MENPYTPPASDVATGTEQAASGELAARSTRFFAALIDGVVMMILVAPVMYLSGFWALAAAGSTSFGVDIMAAIGGFLAYTLVNGYFLAQSGQTVGKRMMKIKIVNLDGSQPPLPQILMRRLLPIQAAGLVPVVGRFISLVDALFIFREDYRCIHDHIAGTKVVKA